MYMDSGSTGETSSTSPTPTEVSSASPSTTQQRTTSSTTATSPTTGVPSTGSMAITHSVTASSCEICFLETACHVCTFHIPSSCSLTGYIFLLSVWTATTGTPSSTQVSSGTTASKPSSTSTAPSTAPVQSTQCLCYLQHNCQSFSSLRLSMMALLFSC